MHGSDSVEIYAREWKFQQRVIDGVAILGVGVTGNCEPPDVVIATLRSSMHALLTSEPCL